VTGAIVAILLQVFSGLLLAQLATRQFGGQTGDELGAMEQLGEAVILLVASSLF